MVGLTPLTASFNTLLTMFPTRRTNILTAAMVLASSLVSLAQPIPPPTIAPTIRSGGTGVVLVSPDMAMIMTSFTAFSSLETGSPSEAEKSVLSTSSAFLDGLTDFGVPEANTTQSSFQNVPHYVLSNDTNPVLVINGWDATVMFTTSTGDVTLAANISALATELGGSVNSVSFTASEPSRRIAYQEALTLAAMDAMARATSMATGLSVSVGLPIFISDTGAPIPTPFYGMRAMVTKGDSSSGFAEVGLITVQADVDAAFGLIAQNQNRTSRL